MVRTLDIFCGAGGSSSGARAAGAEICAGIDMDQVATATYSENFPNTHVITKRLEDISLSALKRKLGSIDLLLASPECTNHTCAKGAAPRSEASRATAMTVIEYARVFRPRWLVLENVVHIRPWSRYNELKAEFSKLGYHLDEQILNAADLGVAQSRRRLFLVGDRSRPPNRVTQFRTGRKPSVKSILDSSGSWKTSLLYADNRARGTLERASRAFAAIGKSSPFLLVYYGSDGSGGWQRLDKPLRTITTIDRFALVEPSADGPRMRMLQVPELKRAMGFEDGFRLEMGSRRDKIRLLGNGVCPPVMQAVVSSLTSTEIDVPRS